MLKLIKSIISDSISVKQSLLEDEELISQILKGISVITSSLKNGKKVMICGNGGSAADSQHMAAEFIGKIGVYENYLPVIALTTDTSVITSISNDYDFSEIFSRQLKALGNPGDILIVISTSGNSVNLVKAVKTSKEMGVISIGILGGNGGNLASIVDIPIIVKNQNTQRIQESQLLIEHIICELVKKQLQDYS